MFTGAGRVELVEERLPVLGSGEVYARTIISGISHGTEIAWLTGEAAALHRTWDTERRVFLDGAGRDYPVAPGYEVVAAITEVGPGVAGVDVGDLVYLDRPHADGYIVSETTALAGLVPLGTPPDHAVF